MKRYLLYICCGVLTVFLSACSGNTPAFVTETVVVNPNPPSSQTASKEPVSALSSAGEKSTALSESPAGAFRLGEGLSVQGSPFHKITDLKDEKQIVINGKRQTLLPIQTDNGDLTGYCYDHYKDADDNLYQFYAGTNVLASYEKQVDQVVLGNTEVEPTAALAVCKDFLGAMGYDITDFKEEPAGPYRYEWKVLYSYYYQGQLTSENITVYCMADEAGQVYVTGLKACDYGRYSKDDDFVGRCLSFETQLQKVQETLSSKGASDYAATVIWKDEKDIPCLRTTIITQGGTETIITY